MTTNIIRTSADGRTSKRTDFTGKDVPLSFRHCGNGHLAETTEQLCTFMKYAVSAMIEHAELSTLVEYEAESCAKGFELCMDLIRDRLDIISGYHGAPTYNDDRG